MSDSLLDIVVPVKNRGDWLELCLTAIKNWTPVPYKIYLVDNLCDERATKYLIERAAEGEFGPCQVLPGTNKSFSNSVNLGARAGDGKNIVVLNSDAIVTPGWASHFLADLADLKVGLTGARSNAAAGLQGDSSGLGQVMDPNYLVFVCVAMRREVFNAIGGMDEATFGGWSAEDLDCSFTIKKSGGRLKLSNAYVLHGLSQTLSKEIGGPNERIANDQKWMQKLVEKWGAEYVIDSSRPRPRVMVCAFSGTEMTRVAFLQQMIGLRKGTAFDFDYAHWSRIHIAQARQSAAESVLNINKALRAKGELTFDYVLQIDDDAVIPSDALMRLLAHKKDITCGIAYQRAAPYLPCVFELSEDQLHVSPVDIEHTGLREIASCGFHFILIKVSVFEKLREFYVEKAKAKGVEDLEELQREREKGKVFFKFDVGKVGEDIYFCRRAREAGLKIHCDTSLVLGHIGDAQVVNEATRKAYLAGQIR